ncbi:cisplatin damage response ATP-dependent DNA ligase [Sphingopyxis yananensis]|uniref:cisplatin damage response ATP-dependent DNA ligase n=1 Tax=Sphingopyxis yananensis TaxID=2886687 RepID=UPI001D11464C|nr:cisplatin damage response ATP-dependent DNA ligase [Sphingopyxis yananensis]MCC2601073.1 cisplatin damage response ATP-dependent DNA ligase [Sphingopyxis yananensis]
MKAFATLLERLAFTNGRNAKMQILRHYLQDTPDPDRGWALAAITGQLELRNIGPALLRRMIAERVDSELFDISYDFVGDLAETIALLWPEPSANRDISLTDAVGVLQSSSRNGQEIAALLDQLDKNSRLAVLKLGTGNLRLGLSARLARTILAQMSDPTLPEIEEIWHALSPPYLDLFAWLAGENAPTPDHQAPFRPVMLSTPTNLEELEKLPIADYQCEWKWDGIRVQLVSDQGVKRVYTRTGDDISAAFPDAIELMDFDGTLDGELLVGREGQIAPFADLQRRLGRKSVSRTMMAEFPAYLRVYDMLIWQGKDWRSEPLSARRAKLDSITFPSPAMDVSPLLSVTTWQDLADLRADPPLSVIEGVMIKNSASRYVGGRPRGPWFKWKRDPMLIDAVLLYAQTGHGKRSGFHSDFTFGVWRDEELVPVGKAYFGFTDEELRQLDKFVRKNTVERFGPVRRLKPELVVEVAFEGLNKSSRHKSGVAMRFPRISRIRWDKPAAEADHLSALEALL